ncbi:hypothetical protein A2316_01235 [Candidatus Falkowbacteria bacterium RIFOXYB2_FULL_38_15]|uniref:TrbC/VIRB2 family protein n=1 Tax=Candidatus Falkowbacteria bacterium RIFOXYA2_FULL_38_12 TaxID=1797993 RepID=A0A1F5S5G8_9BACT|nr:MAG: hypothetical protein A2257_02635 [Candidatus Falkowbacteria bacterium RIFOXYA2_FULL_38_12]OGF32804.1 MAG: hypothetical protein A2316_01235 [Candidatus Falkowbacteria bacterium RIFOXYB2_FULL_38_15]
MKKKILVGLMCLTLLCMALPYAVSAQGEADEVFGLDVVGEEGGLSETLGDTADPRVVASRIINIALGFLGIIAVVLVLYGGFMWMTAAGNEERVTKAKQILTAALIGLVIIIMAWGLTQFVMDQLMSATSA